MFNSTLPFQILRAIWVILLAAASVVFVYLAAPLLYPFIIGFLIAYLLQPLIRLLEHKAKAPRWLAVTGSLVLFLGVIGGLLTLVITRIVNEMERLSQFINNNYIAWLERFDVLIHSDLLRRLTERVTELYEASGYQSTVDNGIASIGQDIANYIIKILQGLGQLILGFVTALPNITLGLVVAIIAAFFIAKEWEHNRNWFSSKMPERANTAIFAVWADLRKALFGFIQAQLILISITAVFVIIGLFLLRVPYALTIGLLIGLVDLMPYLGTGAVFVPWIIYVFLDGNIALGIGLSVLYAIILIARQIAEPKVYSSSLNLRPLATLIALFVGLQLFGFLGLILGPVILVLGSSFSRAGVFRDLRRYIVQGKLWE